MHCRGQTLTSPTTHFFLTVFYLWLILVPSQLSLADLIILLNLVSNPLISNRCWSTGCNIVTAVFFRIQGVFTNGPDSTTFPRIPPKLRRTNKVLVNNNLIVWQSLSSTTWISGINCYLKNKHVCLCMGLNIHRGISGVMLFAYKALKLCITRDCGTAWVQQLESVYLASSDFFSGGLK